MMKIVYKCDNPELEHSREHSEFYSYIIITIVVITISKRGVEFRVWKKL